MTGLMTNQFYQLAYVTNDIDEAIRVFGERFGVPNWFTLRDYEMTIGGGKALRGHIGLANRGDMQLELIAPLSGDDHVYRQVLDGSDRFQLVHHHVAQLTPSLEVFDAVRDTALRQGLALSIDDVAANGTHYFYADTSQILGHQSEYLYYPPDVLAQLNGVIPQN